MKKPFFLLTILIILSCASILLSVMSGAISIPFSNLLFILDSTKNTFDHNLIFSLRLPHVLTTYVIGALLALAGTLMQVLLRNPLADPYILGLSGGSAIGVLSAMLLGLSTFWQTGSGIIGSCSAVLLVFGFTRLSGSWSSLRLLLTGIILSFAFTAVISLILTISPQNNLHSMLFWLLGDITSNNYPTFAFCILIFAFIFSFALSRSLNILNQGSLYALSVGVATKSLEIQLYFLSAVVTAVAVTLAGCIGFVGLIVPHIVRLLVGSDHRYVIPCSILFGGTLLTCADIISRTLFSPVQLPVGIITAFVGVPFFLFLLPKLQYKI